MLSYKKINCHNVTDKVIQEALKYDCVTIEPDYHIRKYKLEEQQEFKNRMESYGYTCHIRREGVDLYYVMEKINKNENIEN